MNTRNIVKGTLSGDAHVQVNKRIARTIGFVEAGLLGELISTHNYAEQQNALYKGDWFYLTQATIEKRLGIKRREHDTAIKNLVKNGLIDKKKMGLPAKSYYLINWDNIAKIFDQEEPKKEEKEPKKEPESPSLSDCTKRTNKEVQNVQTRMDDSYNHDVTKRTTIRTIDNKDLITTTYKNNYYPSLSKDSINMIYSTLTACDYERELINEIIELIEKNNLTQVTQKDIIAQAQRNKAKRDLQIPSLYFIDGLKKFAGKTIPSKIKTSQEPNTSRQSSLMSDHIERMRNILGISESN